MHIPYRNMKDGDYVDVPSSEFEKFPTIRAYASERGRAMGCVFSCNLLQSGALRVTRKAQREQPSYYPIQRR